MAHGRGKVALVTGASRGIGAESAARLARDGFHVVLNYMGGADAADIVVAKMRQAGGQATAMQADVSDSGAVRGLFDRVGAASASSTSWLTTPGSEAGRLAEMSDEHFDGLI